MEPYRQSRAEQRYNVYRTDLLTEQLEWLRYARFEQLLHHTCLVLPLYRMSAGREGFRIARFAAWFLEFAFEQASSLELHTCGASASCRPG